MLERIQDIFTYSFDSHIRKLLRVQYNENNF